MSSLLISLAAFLLNLVASENIDFSGEIIKPGSVFHWGLSLVSPSEGTLAHIDADLSFTKPESLTDPIASSIIAIDPSDLPLLDSGDVIGVSYKGQLHACCTSELIDAHQCDRLSSLMFNRKLVTVLANQTLEQTDTSVSFSFDYPRTAYALLIVGICPISENISEDQTVSMSGKVSIHHDYGKLSPIDYRYLPFYGYISLLYVLLAIVWGYVNVRHSTEIMQVQHSISLVIVLCCVEMFSWYNFYNVFNKSGYRMLVPFALALITSSIRRAVSRMLVVAVAMGLGVSKPSLGPSRYRVLTAGFVYLILEVLLQWSQHLSSSPSNESRPSLLWLIVPVTLMDSAFYWWIFVSLSNTLDDLRLRRQPSKHAHMRSFAALLLASLAAVTLFSVFRIYFMEQFMEFKHWQWTFLLLGGFSQIMYLSVLVGIAILWRPGPNSRSIAYAEQVAQHDFDDEFDLELKDVTSPALGIRQPASQFGIGDEDDDDL